MTDKLEHDMQRGEEALRILNSPVFADAFDQVRQAYLRTWEALPTADTEDAQDVHRRIKALADVRKQLEAIVSGGKLAAKTLTKRERIANAARRLNPFANTRGGM